MRSFSLLGVLGIACIALVCGCSSPSELSNADIAAQKKKYGKEAYDQAMIAAGKTKELEQQKKDNADRDGQQR